MDQRIQPQTHDHDTGEREGPPVTPSSRGLSSSRLASILVRYAHAEWEPDVNDRRICVYCASSRTCHAEYHGAARRVGQNLARARFTVVYGGGGEGSMGALADGALASGGRVVGVLPRFMKELEWGHPRLSELHLVEDLRERKARMLEGSLGVVALPGGSGTLDELLETITLKRLGLYPRPIVLVNTRRFFDPLLQLLSSAVSERFMDEGRHPVWQVVAEPEEVPAAIAVARS
jgi:uncharacterized protein (TIGR00730 family)